MEYVYLIGLAIAIVVWIVKSIIRFFKWVAASFSGTSTAPAGTAPMPPRPAAAPASLPPRNISPSPVAPRQAEARPVKEPPTVAAPAPPVLSSLSESPSPTGIPQETPPLFGSTDSLVRAFILSEVLGPPLSRSRKPRH